MSLRNRSRRQDGLMLKYVALESDMLGLYAQLWPPTGCVSSGGYFASLGLGRPAIRSNSCIYCTPLGE